MKKVKLYNKNEIESIRLACQISSHILDLLYHVIKVGISTEDINQFVHNETLKCGGIPAPLNYHGFPKSVCTSVNDVICHGIPNEKEILKDSDIINVDVTTIFNGFYGDTNRMYVVGDSFKNENKHLEKKKLIKTTYEAMILGINAVKDGGHLTDIGYAIENYAKKNGFSIVKDFAGHGIGDEFHQFPDVLHYVPQKIVKDIDVNLKTGMVFTIEPMINAGSYHSYVDKNDKWTARTIDGSLSAQFEHTIAITENGVNILTKTDIDVLKKIYC